MKNYRNVPIRECGDPLVAIPDQPFSFTRPHPYVVLEAPYGGVSPWMLRTRVLDALHQAHAALAMIKPGWRLKLFDAYRPVSVQAFMVWREFRQQAALSGVTLTCAPADLQVQDPELFQVLSRQVFEFWSVPSEDPHSPPPHSTGAAVDVTLEDGSGREIDMGSPIDETTERSYPDYYADAGAGERRTFNEQRQLLHRVMSAAGFCRHDNEWWHFSLGDQMWALARGEAAAIYGRA